MDNPILTLSVWRMEFSAVRKLSENFLFVGEFSCKMRNLGLKNRHLGEFRGKTKF